MFTRAAALFSVMALAVPVPALAQISQIPGIVMDDEPRQPVTITGPVTNDRAAPVFRGTVMAETGEPVKGATVRATIQQPYPSSLTTTTNKDGRFAFLVRRSGRWDFIVEAPGFASVVESADVRRTSTQHRLEVTLERVEAPELSGALAGVIPLLISTQLAAADTLFAAGRYDEAIAAYQKMKAQIPALTAISLQLGNSYLQKKDYDRAEAEFQVVLKSEAANAAACYDLGQVKAARGLSDEAAAWYQKAAAADPVWTKPLMRLAVLAQSKDDREAAIGFLKRVIALNPDSSEAAQAASMLGRSGRVN